MDIISGANAPKQIGVDPTGYSPLAQAHHVCRPVKLSVKLHAKNVTHTQHSPTCFFLYIQGEPNFSRSTIQGINAHFYFTPRELLSTHIFCQWICKIIQSVNFFNNAFLISTMSLTKLYYASICLILE